MNLYRVTKTTIEEFAVRAPTDEAARRAHLNLDKRIIEPPKESEEGP